MRKVVLESTAGLFMRPAVNKSTVVVVLISWIRLSFSSHLAVIPIHVQT